MLSPKKLQYQQINKIITSSVVFIYIFYQEIIGIFILFLGMQGWAGRARDGAGARLRAAQGVRKYGEGGRPAPGGGAGLRC